MILSDRIILYQILADSYTPPELEEFWLDPDVTDPAALTGVLSPYPDAPMDYYEVSTLVNKAANSGPDLIVPVGQRLLG